MKRLVQYLTVLLILLISLYSGQACTSFAVYTQDVIYGMNFDFPVTEIKLVVNDTNETKSFAMMFKQGDSFLPTISMNDQGLFASTQMQYPSETGKSERSENEFFVSEIQLYMDRFKTVEEVLSYLENKKLVHHNSYTLHNLITDPEGNAAILEVGEDQNEFVKIDDDFIVMTNFKNSDYRNIPHDSVTGVGADRYQKVYQHIIDNKENFDINTAFEGLKMTSQGGGGPTLCSMVFKPKENTVYVALSRNFDKIWKIAIEEKTIETFQGFSKNIKLQIPNSGVLASDLINSNFKNYDSPYNKAVEGAVNDNQNKSFNILLVFVLAIVISCYCYYKKKNAS